jgi:subtilisin family serine protease
MEGRLPSPCRRISALVPAIVVLAAGFALAPASSATGGPVGSAEPGSSIPGELVVGFQAGATRAEQHAATRAAGTAIEERIPGGAVVSTDAGVSAGSAARELRADRAVDFVEPNYVVHAANVPNDPGFDQQWGLHNEGQLGGLPGADIHAPQAWDVLTGGPVTVAVVDTGVDYTHPDLAPNLWSNPADPENGVDDDGNGMVDDTHGTDFVNGDSDPADDSGHGTHVSGIIGARGGNGIGVAGVDWDLRLMALKFLDASGAGNTGDAVRAIDYAVNRGAQVINASWGGPDFSQALYDAVKRAGDRGVLVVAAAGNSGRNADATPDYPAAFDLSNVVSVAATDRSDRLIGFSNYGAKSVDLGAPGEAIYSTVPHTQGGSSYALASGTSMAAPFVSGAAALYRARTPASSPSQVRDALLGSVDPVPTLAGKTVTGGRLDIAKALGVVTPAAPSAQHPERDVTPPSPFLLVSPRNRHRGLRRSLRFRWEQARDESGIKCYKLFVDGRKRQTLCDPDGPGGREAPTHARIRLSGGRHRWFVRAYDYAGNHRTARRSRGGASSSRVLYIRTSGRR